MDSLNRQVESATSTVIPVSGQSSILVSDAWEALRGIEDKTFQCCVTSPPYWGLRDYGVPGQIGAEESLGGYISNLGQVFDEVRRTLRDDGTLWLNLGDSYTSGGRRWRAPDRKNGARAMSYRAPTPAGLKPKDLIGAPWRVAFALQERGWYLRSDIIWHKPNCQPESVRDRPTLAHEYFFLFSKSERYYYDSQGVREPADGGCGTRNLRSVWTVNTTPFAEAHFATFPPALIEPAIRAGSRPRDLILDPFFGAGTVGLVALEMNREFIGIELNPEYAEMAVRRLSERSGRVSTERLATGK